MPHRHAVLALSLHVGWRGLCARWGVQTRWFADNIPTEVVGMAGFRFCPVDAGSGQRQDAPRT